MKLRIASDLHTEFFGADEIGAYANEFMLPPLPEDKETALLLAGDIGSAQNPECLLNFLEAVCPRFEQVLMIPGNHEYYYGNIITTPDKIKKMIEHIPNVHFGFATGVKMDEAGPTIHMHTLWTDFDKGNPLSMMQAQSRMNDYRLIRIDQDVLMPKDTLALHQWHLEILEDTVEEGDIVMTHHSPSMFSIPHEYLTDRVNGAYHSDLNEFILRKKPRIWIHGHTHTATTYMLGDTKVICNPRGYGKQHRSNGYDPVLVVEV